MTRAEKAERIITILDRLHSEVPIPLEHADPFTLLVAVVLSAHVVGDGDGDPPLRWGPGRVRVGDDLAHRDVRA